MKPYNIDLRKKVIEFLEDGNTQAASARVFNLNKSTVNRWYLQYKRTGDLLHKKYHGSKPRIDKVKLVEYVNKHSNGKLEDFALVFKVSTTAIFRCLKQLKFVFKKNLYLRGSRSKKTSRLFRRNKRY